MSAFSPILDDLFGATVPNEKLILLKQLKALYPNQQHVGIHGASHFPFPLSSFLNSVDVSVEVFDDPATNNIFEWDSKTKKVYADVVCGIMRFTYAGTEFAAYKATWSRDGSDYYFYDLVFDAGDDSIGQKLASEVYTWANSLKNEIWVYQTGRWTKSKQLYEAIQNSRWEDVVLESRFQEGLSRDTNTFFASRDVYQSLGITWKRGILLLGPPGNGKTESIKALLNETKHPALYVKSFMTPYGPEYGVRSVFEHARKHSPCILVLEDLDAMVSSTVRSFFLNELDGLAQNGGILTIATTNHPEDIDDAILNRPSRFDTKYNFDLPNADLRRAFAVKWIRKVRTIGPGASGAVFEQDEEEVARGVAERTDGWSFAFLKELFVSFLLRLAHDKSSLAGKRPINGFVTAESVLFSQLDQLSSQIIKIKTAADEKKKENAKDEDSRWCPPGAEDNAFIHAGANF